MCKKLPLNEYKWADTSIFTEDFMKNYNEEGYIGYLLEVDVEYPKELAGAHRNLPFLPERRYKLIKKISMRYQKRLKRLIKECINSLISLMSLKIS